MTLTWVDIGVIFGVLPNIRATFGVLIVGSLIAGFIVAWWVKRKRGRDKNKRG